MLPIGSHDRLARAAPRQDHHDDVDARLQFLSAACCLASDAMAPGLPSDVVGMTNGVLSLNGQSHQTSDLARFHRTQSVNAPRRRELRRELFRPVPDDSRDAGRPGQVYVLGDNRAYGYVELRDGKRQQRPELASTRLIGRDRVTGKVVVPPLPEFLAQLIR